MDDVYGLPMAFQNKNRDKNLFFSDFVISQMVSRGIRDSFPVFFRVFERLDLISDFKLSRFRVDFVISGLISSDFRHECTRFQAVSDPSI